MQAEDVPPWDYLPGDNSSPGDCMGSARFGQWLEE